MQELRGGALEVAEVQQRQLEVQAAAGLMPLEEWIEVEMLDLDNERSFEVVLRDADEHEGNRNE